MNTRLLPRIIAILFSFVIALLGVLGVASLFGVGVGLDFSHIVSYFHDTISLFYLYPVQEMLWLILLGTLGLVSLGTPWFRLLMPFGSARLGRNDVLSKRFHKCLRIMCLLAGGFMAGYTHLVNSLPVGGDTLAYIFDTNYVLHHGFQWAFAYTDFPLVVWLSALVKLLSGLPTAQAMGLFGSLLAVSLGFASWKYCDLLFGKNLYGDEITTLAVFFTAFSPVILRSTIDIYASLLGQGLLLFSLYLSINPPPSSGASRKLLASAAFVLLLLSYWAFWVLAILIVPLCTKGGVKGIRSVTWVLLPSLILFGSLLVYSALFPPPTYWGIGRSILNYFGQTSVPTFNGVLTVIPSFTGVKLSALPQGLFLGELFGEGNFFVALFALFGLLFVNPRDANLRSLYLMSFLFALGVLSISYGTHAAAAYPSMILAAVGTTGILHFRESLRG